MISTIYVAVVDVVTDALSTTLPVHSTHFKADLVFTVIGFAGRVVWMIKRSQRDKMGLGIALSLTAVTVIIAIARACEISGRTFRDPIRLALWGIVESSIGMVLRASSSTRLMASTAVVVGCLPALRLILTQPRRKREIPARAEMVQNHSQAASDNADPPSTVNS